MTAPATINALLAARLDQLEATERAVLQRGSVEGQVFHRSAVEWLSAEAEHADVDTALSQLVMKELLEPDGAEFSDEAFRFHHLLLRDVAYDSVEKGSRAAMHERFAAWLDDRVGERTSEYDEIAGYHLEQAVRYQSELRAGGSADGELAERAGMRLGSAGLRAHARGDWPAAVSLLTRASGLLPAGAKAQSTIQPKLADALIEIEPVKPSLFRSTRCFWSWRPGHRWTIKARSGLLVDRCAVCGKERTRRVEGELFDPYERDRKMEQLGQKSGGWMGGGDWGGTGGGDMG
jgi:predicted ATPase